MRRSGIDLKKKYLNLFVLVCQICGDILMIGFLGQVLRCVIRRVVGEVKRYMVVEWSGDGDYIQKERCSQGDV